MTSQLSLVHTDVKTATNKYQILPHAIRKMNSLSRSLDAQPVDHLLTNIDERSSYSNLIGCFPPKITNKRNIRMVNTMC